MHQLSTLQLLDLWHQLERAYYKDANFGGDTAEVYQYALMRACPAAEAVKKRQEIPGAISSIAREAADEVFQEANDALYSTVKHFIKMREIDTNKPGVRVTVIIPPGQKEFGTWVREIGPWHRMQIKVENLRG